MEKKCNQEYLDKVREEFPFLELTFWYISANTLNCECDSFKLNIFSKKDENGVVLGFFLKLNPIKYNPIHDII